MAQAGFDGNSPDMHQGATFCTVPPHQCTLQLLLHPHGEEGPHPPLELQQPQSQQPSLSALTWGVKLTLAPRFSSNWATLRFS